MAIVQVNPDNEKSALITPGEHGKDSPVVLTKVEYGANRFRPQQRELTLVLSINDPTHGRMTRTLRIPDWDSGSKVPRFLRQLGVTDEEQRSGFDTDKLHDIQVLVNIGIREYKKDDGTPGADNSLIDIRRISD